MPGHTVVIDVGKSVAKVSLWTPEGFPLARVHRTNAPVAAPAFRALDALGIEQWLAGVLARFSARARIGRIIPVGHGAGMALVRDSSLLLLPMDYEQPIPEAVRARYDQERDAFAETGSPALPDGLNLGAQLFWLEDMYSDVLKAGTQLVTWAQYWAWRLSGVGATEMTSLGCHTDLWNPQKHAPSGLAERRGWASALAPLRDAGSSLGTVSAEWMLRAHLSPDTAVYCGLHDSNAALLAGRGFGPFAEREVTILSTGTWFIAMRSGVKAFANMPLPANRDCLLNVDIHGVPVPSARFMGGREIEMLLGADSPAIDDSEQQASMLDAVPQVLAQEIHIAPTQVPGCGPYPQARGGWKHRPDKPADRAAAVALYAALMVDASLELIGAQHHLLIEGRFAGAQVFVRALAALRPDLAVHVAPDGLDASFGALRAIDPSLQLSVPLQRVEPLLQDLQALRAAWREEAAAA